MEFFLEKTIGTIVAKTAIKAVAAINKRGYKNGTFKSLKNGISMRLLTEIFLKIIEFAITTIGTDKISDKTVEITADIIDSFK